MKDDRINFTTYLNNNTYEVRTISEMVKIGYGIYSEREDDYLSETLSVAIRGKEAFSRFRYFAENMIY